MRKKKGLPLDLTRDAIADATFFCTTMVHNGDADGKKNPLMQKHAKRVYG